MNKSKKQMWLSESLSMTTIIALIIDEYGPEALNWDPQTVVMEVETDIGHELSEIMDLKIGCAMNVMVNPDSFYKSLPDFITICNIASDDISSINLWNPADAYEITATVAEVRFLNPPEQLDNPFGPDIVGYIELVLREEGVTVPPKCLNFVSRANLAVKDLGTVEGDPQIFAAAYQESQEASASLQEYEDNTLKKVLQELSQIEFEHGSMENLWRKKNAKYRGNDRPYQRR